jgi:hypothetical protein
MRLFIMSIIPFHIYHIISYLNHVIGDLHSIRTLLACSELFGSSGTELHWILSSGILVVLGPLQAVNAVSIVQDLPPKFAGIEVGAWRKNVSVQRDRCWFPVVLVAGADVPAVVASSGEER